MCTQVDFECDRISEPDSTVEKLGEFIDAHIPDDDGVCSIHMMLVGLKDSRGNTVKSADDFI